ncbi:stalk domain-containing protein [Clostridium butyricum]|uniref:Cell wall-binding protein n=1 Tax=Clostridium butyricum TaxID=1492 RepID=A0A2S7F792_CLOBU|nr:stalk domain-containing protein [Clostridium butyricum]KHD14129.1 cell wall-binding protein [Clostridium butyricum]MBZ5747710.1 cell wall-binding protein [Clostridium butyricum]MDU4752428.1 stalk domain-containing protein [Clostridium butyricum]PPV12905.1 cell wall-binding protein [Clostridium butyricum]QMW92814.1 cell wall-binding protein [Clostridium butyricum]
MKKLMIGLLTIATVTGMTVPTFAGDIYSVDSNLEQRLVSTNISNELVNNVTIGGKNINIGNLNILVNKGKIMVPLKATAKSLGFKVTINKDNRSASLDNANIKTQIQIGIDSYYYESSKAIGMTAPEKLGAEPILVDNNIYVPIKMYNILLNDSNAVGSFWTKTKDGQWVYVDKGELAIGWKLIHNKWYFMNSNGIMENGWIQTNGNWYYLYDNGEMAIDTITPDGYKVDLNGKWDFGKKVSIDDIKAGIPSPIEEFKTIEEAQKVLDFNITFPKEIPSEYDIEYISTISKKLFQICYTDGKDEVLYRMGQDVNNISGDYNNYKNNNIVEIDDKKIKLSGNDDFIKLATWNVNDMSYSISSSNGISKDKMINIIKSVKYEGK